VYDPEVSVLHIQYNGNSSLQSTLSFLSHDLVKDDRKLQLGVPGYAYNWGSAVSSHLTGYVEVGYSSEDEGLDEASCLVGVAARKELDLRKPIPEFPLSGEDKKTGGRA
ncbi:hypothetical protein FRC01_007943, partial [Tulasnella sp. 417]